MGTLVSMLVLWFITVFLVYAATLRFIDPPEIKGNIMFITAVLGLFFNLIQMSILDSADPVIEDEGNQESKNSDLN